VFRSPISFTGAVLTTASAVTFLIVFCADLFGWHTNPYLGILFFLILPGIFLLGLALIPLGGWLERRRVAQGRPPHERHWPRLDLNDPVHRARAVVIVTLTIVNVVIVSLAAYRGVEYMDSVTFCGQVCHAVMEPEFTAHQDAAHSRVACVQCHIGPGASWFARSKISGARQVLAVSFQTYSRPIPSPVQNLRPARETCEVCHWPEKFHGDVVRTIVEYGNDEKNTETVTTLNMHVGGGAPAQVNPSSIHWHVAEGVEIEYVSTDDKRQVIPYVRLKDRSGNVREYVAQGVTPQQIAAGERRRMDCVDCHNRPSHPMAPTADRAVNDAMARGDIPKTLPFVHREAVKALKGSYPSAQAADEAMRRQLRDFYRTQQPAVYTSHRQDVEKAVNGTVAIYRRNVFPQMNVQFGTYPNNIGHIDFPGCFRCHDDDHKAKDGKVIGQDCEACHAIS
jgi:NapC/NirT cytochrome c family, N-terminal region